MMPMAPAAETAPTSSGLLHGYIAPQISGMSTPASRVSCVAVTLPTPGSRLSAPDSRLPTPGSCSRLPEQPDHRAARDDVPARVLHGGDDLVAHLGVDRGHITVAFRCERAARLLEVFHR